MSASQKRKDHPYEHTFSPGRACHHRDRYGQCQSAPDRAQVQVGVRVMAEKAQAAMQGCAKTMHTLLATVKGAGVEERQIRTGILSLVPEYRTISEGVMKRISNTATNMVYITITDLTGLGALLDAVVGAGGDDVIIHGLSLEASDPQQAMDLARRAALQDARHQAEHIAHEMHLTLGAARRIIAQGGTAPQPRGPRMMRAAMVSTPVEAGELEVSASFEVTFAIAD